MMTRTKEEKTKNRILSGALNLDVETLGVLCTEQAKIQSFHSFLSVICMVMITAYKHNIHSNNILQLNYGALAVGLPHYVCYFIRLVVVCINYNYRICNLGLLAYMQISWQTMVLGSSTSTMSFIVEFTKSTELFILTQYTQKNSLEHCYHQC